MQAAKLANSLLLQYHYYFFMCVFIYLVKFIYNRIEGGEASSAQVSARMPIQALSKWYSFIYLPLDWFIYFSRMRMQVLSEWCFSHAALSSCCLLSLASAASYQSVLCIAVDTVCRSLAEYVALGGDWRLALAHTVPQRFLSVSTLNAGDSSSQERTSIAGLLKRKHAQMVGQD